MRDERLERPTAARRRSCEKASRQRKGRLQGPLKPASYAGTETRRAGQTQGNRPHRLPPHRLPSRQHEGEAERTADGAKSAAPSLPATRALPLPLSLGPGGRRLGGDCIGCDSWIDMPVFHPRHRIAAFPLSPSSLADRGELFGRGLDNAASLPLFHARRRLDLKSVGRVRPRLGARGGGETVSEIRGGESTCVRVVSGLPPGHATERGGRADHPRQKKEGEKKRQPVMKR
ncbi:hypothetical protein CDD83_10339 [Cordyceps sp. RAO-2017]|nr:hypothetical protein CDD83_10339 [Cordyceps sp. RAO-2017]